MLPHQPHAAKSLRYGAVAGHCNPPQVLNAIGEAPKHGAGEPLLSVPWWNLLRYSLILPLLEQRVRIIGQVRRDTALFLSPQPEPKRRGCKRKPGLRIDAAMLAALPLTEMELTVYGKAQPVRIRSLIAVARFLKGLPVQAVWCEMRQAHNTWSRPRLILATETDLSAQAGGNLCRALGY
jgi:hypothetical protein